MAKLGQASLLAKLAAEVVVPSEVAAEIRAGQSDDPARLWLESEGRHFIVQAVTHDPRVVAWDLGDGETAVISRALRTPNPICLLDDRAARDCARFFGARVKGTVGVLILAKRAGFIPALRPQIESLIRSGALLHDSVIREALELAGEV
ncbi:MAG: DUF3368 domain-containing protein [Limisphaerales bacterium]